MANFVYKKAKENILNGKINFSLDTFKIALIDNSKYSINQNVDEYISDIPVLAIVTRSNSLSNLTNNLGVIDASDIFLSLGANKSFDAIVLYQSNSSDSDSRLIFYIDTAEGIPFSGSLSSTTINFIWSNNSVRILSL